MSIKKIEDALNALTHIDQSRRGFFKTLVVGSAVAAAVPMMTSVAVAQDAGELLGQRGFGHVRRDQHTAAGIVGDDAAEAEAYGFEKWRAEAFVTVRALAACGQPGQGGCNRHFKHQCQVWHQPHHGG